MVTSHKIITSFLHKIACLLIIKQIIDFFFSKLHYNYIIILYINFKLFIITIKSSNKIEKAIKKIYY